MRVTRRDLLTWSAGAAAGLLATPVPWKVLDDVSIWSQNWPWIRQPGRGPVEVKQSSCTLCAKACGLRVRMAGGWPVGVAGSSTHPISRGALCPLAFAAHQLNWHPKRLRKVQRGSRDSSWTEAQAALAKASKEGPIVIVDGLPGRAASSILERFAAKQGGCYRALIHPELIALQPYEQWTGVPAGCLGYDLENTRTIVSFGAPLLDGWGTPGRFTRLWAESAAGEASPQLRLIQIDSSLSRTAARAWRWIQIREGSESALASGLARALLEQNLVPAHGPVPVISLAESAAQTGLDGEQIQELGRTLVANSPTLVIAAGRQPAVAALNVLLGSVGKRGGLVRRPDEMKSYVSVESPIENARAVVLDASVPWSFTPRTDAEIFRFAAWHGNPTRADWLLPAPGFLEELTDVPTPPGSSLSSYAIAAPLSKPAAEVHSAAQFLRTLDANLPAPEKIIDARCESIFKTRTGAVSGQKIIATREFTSAQRLKEQLWKGDVWFWKSDAPQKLPCRLTEWPTEAPPLRAENWAAQWTAPVMPSLASKLFLESTLRESPAGRNA